MSEVKKRRFYNKGYSEAGASVTKKSMKGFNAQSGSPQEDIDFNNQTLRERSRILAMASPIAASAIKTNRTNVLGMGLRMQPRIDRDVLGISSEQADEMQKHISREWDIWSGNPRAVDALGISNFADIQRLVLQSWLLSGDVFALVQQKNPTPMMPYSTRIMIVEADRIATPTAGNSIVGPMTTGINSDNGNYIYDGVEVDKSGMIVAYHIRNTYPNEYGMPKLTEWSRVKAFNDYTGLANVIQVMDPERPDQYRGVPYLAPVIEQLLQMRRYSESELMAAVIESFFTAFVKTEAGADENPFNETEELSPEERRYQSENEYSMGPGQVNFMEPGEDVVFANPTRPANGFDTFVKSICSQIGAALEIPRDLLLKEFNASYSASRAALMEAWKAFKMRRELIVDKFCNPIYATWFSEAVGRGRINAPGFFEDPIKRNAYLSCEWVGPSQGQLDPEKEVNAEIAMIREGFSTHEQSTARLTGGDWSKNIEQLKKEYAQLEGLGSPDPHQDSGKGGETNA